MSETRLNPYLNFEGQCREAFEFYARCLNAEIVFSLTMGESPMADEVPKETHHRICHICLQGEGMLLMGSDCPPEYYEKPQGIVLNVAVDSVERAEELFAALGEGGQVRMPLEETFWAERFGLLVDKFGVSWMINYDGSKASY